jgi:hypothetical protein
MNVLATNKKKSFFVHYAEKGRFLIEEKDRKLHRIFLDLLTLYSQDKIHFREGNIQSVSFTEGIKDLDTKQLPEVDRLARELDLYIEAKERLEYPVNLELFYSKLFLDLDEENL